MITQTELPFDKKYLIRCLGFMGFMVLVMKATAGMGFLLAFLMLFSCLSRRNDEVLLYTLLVIIGLTMSNPAIVPKGSIFGAAHKILSLTMAGVLIARIAGSKKSVLLGSFIAMLGYIAYMVLPSTVGWCPFISYLKLFLFTMVYASYYGVANSVINSTKVNSQKIRSIFLTFAIYFVIGSVLLIPLGIGQMNYEEAQRAIANGANITSLFMGMTLHSQALGPIIAMFGVVIYADLIFSIKRANRLYMVLLMCVPILVWKTSSRTAMGALIAGVAFTTYFFMQAHNIRRGWKSKVSSAFMMIIAILSMAVLCAPRAREKATNFIMKSTNADSRDVSFESITMSRRGKWESALYNFKQSPMVGNGFQVSEDHIGLKPSLTTLSAPVEKGVWISAILEEGGVVGMVIFLLVVMAIFTSLLSRKCYQGLCAFFELMVLNLGEFTMFSMSSVGGLLWGLVFMGVIFDAQRIKDERAGRFVVYGNDRRIFYAH